ncbi:DUF3040 domain-containing protein [Saccharopolyspora rectivirgula]|jgi:hypothetical protein|uniref:DUF3040 domain-containing protein n=1 Tax=Saccharopolyspora rectivirgula TaxID=28042 RepID=A0A073B155_9PSEU|nr:DUF3040 domain-containing protein [Saccharopolyspora rectivirgula]KEI45017.1 hypothetical protein GU90_07385 [Saccharopolyspora rectivirgula]
MLPKDERRRLKEIEDQLAGDDPKLAQRLSGANSMRLAWARLNPRLVLVIATALLALLCLVLGEGAGFFLAGVLAVMIFVFRNWRVQSE